jgi:hypothetical protein
VFFQVINVQVTNQESAQADWNAQLDDFEKLMLLKALKEEKVNLSFRDKHSKVNIYTHLLVLDDWEMSQVSVSILTCYRLSWKRATYLSVY